MQRALIWLCGGASLFAVAWFCALPKVQTLQQTASVPAAAQVLPAMVSMRVQDGRLAMAGVVANDAQRQDLIAAAAAAFGDRVDHKIELQAGVQADWLGSPSGWMAPLVALPSIRLALNGRQAVLGGEIDSDEARQSLIDALRAGLGPQVAIDDQMKTVLSAERLVADMNAMVLVDPLSFEIGEAQLTSTSGKVLDGLAAKARGLPQLAIVVAGHSDSIGELARNRQLSLARAQAVADALVARGIGPSRLTVRGFGAERPVADNNNPEGRARNRRVEFMVATR